MRTDLSNPTQVRPPALGLSKPPDYTLQMSPHERCGEQLEKL